MIRILYYGENLKSRIPQHYIKLDGTWGVNPNITAYEVKGYKNFEEAKQALVNEDWGVVGINMVALCAGRFITFARLETSLPLIVFARMETYELGEACDALGVVESGRTKRILARSLATRKNIEQLISGQGHIEG